MDKYKNWKTTTSFLVLLVCFIHAVVTNNVPMVDTLKYPVLFMWMALKVSSEALTKGFENLTERFKK